MFSGRRRNRTVDATHQQPHGLFNIGYCNGLPADLPASQMARLESVFWAPARRRPTPEPRRRPPKPEVVRAPKVFADRRLFNAKYVFYYARLNGSHLVPESNRHQLLLNARKFTHFFGLWVTTMAAILKNTYAFFATVTRRLSWGWGGIFRNV